MCNILYRRVAIVDSFAPPLSIALVVVVIIIIIIVCRARICYYRPRRSRDLVGELLLLHIRLSSQTVHRQVPRHG